MSSKSVSVLFIISTILLVLSKSASSSSSLIKTACSTTNRDNFNVVACTGMLESDKKTASAKNFLELSSAILKATIASATETREYMIQKLNDKSSKSNQQVYGQCKLSYDSAISNIEGALSELKEDPMSSTYDLSLASNDSMQPCLAALKAAAGFDDQMVLSGNESLFIHVFAAIAAANNI